MDEEVPSIDANSDSGLRRIFSAATTVWPNVCNTTTNTCTYATGQPATIDKTYVELDDITCKAGYYFDIAFIAGPAICRDVTSGYFSPNMTATRTECLAPYTDSSAPRAANTDCYYTCPVGTLPANCTTISNVNATVYDGAVGPDAQCRYNVTTTVLGFEPANNGTASPTCEPAGFAITYYLYNGTHGTPTPPSAYNIATPIVTLSSPTRANSTFDGWFTTSAFAIESNTIPTGSTGELEFHAKWLCAAGYYADTPTTCSEVGEGYFSPINDLNRYICPDGFTTFTPKATIISSCYKDEVVASIDTNGDGGMRRTYSTASTVWPNVCNSATNTCLYAPGQPATIDKTYVELDDITCKAGYYFDISFIAGPSICRDVTSGWWSPNMTAARTVCPPTNTGSDAPRGADTDCYYSCPAKSVVNSEIVKPINAKEFYTGAAYPTCTYSVICKAGMTAENESCVECPAGKTCACTLGAADWPTCLCTPDDPDYPNCGGPSCIPGSPEYPLCLCSPSNPNYPNCNPPKSCPVGYTDGPATGLTEIDQCQKQCLNDSSLIANGTLVANAQYVNHPNTCSFTLMCDKGYIAEGGACVLCPTGKVCTGVCLPGNPDYPTCLCTPDDPDYPNCGGPSCIPGNSEYPMCLCSPSNPNYPNCGNVFSCPNGGTSQPGVSTVQQCFKSMPCNTQNGTGEKTCYYTSGAGSAAIYGDNCTSCKADNCDAGFHVDNGVCETCPAGAVCDGTCVSGGAGWPTCLCTPDDPDYPNCGGSQCAPGNPGYPECLCTPKNPYYPNCGSVRSCPAPGTSAHGATSLAQCFITCVRPIIDGAASITPNTDYGSYYSGAAYPACSFSVACKSGFTLTDNNTAHPRCVINCAGAYHPDPNNDNACEPNIKNCTTPQGSGYMEWDGTAWSICKTQECPNDQENTSGQCQPCDRDHALSYKTSGNCLIDACEHGFHPNGTKCEADVMECSITNAEVAERTWNSAEKVYGPCKPVRCMDGFHISANACVTSGRACDIENGAGVQNWIGDHLTGSWDECQVTSCNPGWTTDKYETGEPGKPCGACRNKFGMGGEIAASTYVKDCEIASCMYQGELYNLENNECLPICDPSGREDETGAMSWNNITHKCDRVCKQGFIPW
jgi:uncharacterized repeat protein (TIGR02543 family)